MLSQASGYAALALSAIAQERGKPLLVKDIAAAADIPAPYLAKIVQVLARRGLVHTQRGIGGGVTLAKPAHQLTMYEVCEVLNDPVIADRCMMGVAPCRDSQPCPCHNFWKQHRGEYLSFLKNTTISDMAIHAQRQARLAREGAQAAAEAVPEVPLSIPRMTAPQANGVGSAVDGVNHTT